jgi:hypothetical protein
MTFNKVWRTIADILAMLISLHCHPARLWWRSRRISVNRCGQDGFCLLSRAYHLPTSEETKAAHRLINTEVDFLLAD